MRIGSRGSKLALFQAEKVRDRLRNLFPEFSFEIEVIKTEGDQPPTGRGDSAAGRLILSDQGVFTKAIDEALQAERIDFAVHSAKDLPTQLLNSLEVGAVLERDEVRDAWISPAGVSLENLGKGAAVATGSPRRKAQTLRLRPDLNIVEIRGNVPTRLKKVREGLADGLILAACGLIRLGLEGEITEILEKGKMFPAVGQGAIVVEIKKGHEIAVGMAQALNHEESFLRVEAERSLLRALRGGCQVPVGALSNVNGTRLILEAAIFSPDGKDFVSGRIEGDGKDAVKLGKTLAERLKGEGGARILEEIRKSDPIQIQDH